MKIPFLDLNIPNSEIRPQLNLAIQRVMDSGNYIMGNELEKFETEFSKYTNSRYCAGVANGLDAIQIILKAGGVGPGDEVIVPSFTFIATWLAVSHLGAVPVPVEIDERTYNLDPQKIAERITLKTKAVIAVHLYGQMAEMDKLVEICKDRNLLLVEDAAQAHGAKFNGRVAGSTGDAAAFSFYPGKNLGAFGDGGAVTCQNSMFDSNVRKIRNYGCLVKYQHDELGCNSRLDEIQAAILSVKLAKLDQWNSLRRKQADLYLKNLNSDKMVLPFVHPNAEPVWHLFVVRLHDRSMIQKRLEDAGIQTIIHYPVSPHLQLAYRNLGINEKALPIATRVQTEVLSLPIGPHLSANDIIFVCDTLNKCF